MPGTNPIAEFLDRLAGGFERGTAIKYGMQDRNRRARLDEDERARVARQEAAAGRTNALNEALIREQHGIGYVEPGTEQRTPAFDAARLRTGVADGLTPPRVGMQAGRPAAPTLDVPDFAATGPQFTTTTHAGGFEKVAPNAIERQQAQAAQLRRRVAEGLSGRLGVNVDEADAMLQGGLADEQFALNNPAPPPAITPFQRESLDLEGRRVGIAERAANAAQNAPPAPPDFGDTTGLQKQFTSEPIVKNAIELSQAWGKIKSALSTGSPAGDMAGIFSFMKIMDPGSTVREGEYASAKNTTGIPGQILNLYNQAKDGHILNPAQRADFMQQAEAFARNQQKLTAPVIQRYRATAEQYGIDPSNIIYDPMEGLFEPEPEAPPPGPRSGFNLNSAQTPEGRRLLELLGGGR